jgi:hypothetical protein
MLDRHYENYETSIFDHGNDPIVADAITPENRTILRQSMAMAARIMATNNALAQVSQHPSLTVSAEPAQVADGRAVELDSPDRRSHLRLARRLSCRSSLSRLTRAPPRASRRRAR